MEYALKQIIRKTERHVNTSKIAEFISLYFNKAPSAFLTFLFNATLMQYFGAIYFQSRFFSFSEITFHCC